MGAFFASTRMSPAGATVKTPSFVVPPSGGSVIYGRFGTSQAVLPPEGGTTNLTQSLVRTFALVAAGLMAFVSASACSSRAGDAAASAKKAPAQGRSEEHTSELQSLAYLVCRLLLEKK